MIYCSFKLAKKLLFCLFQIISQSPSSQRKMLDKTVLSLTKVIQRSNLTIQQNNYSNVLVETKQNLQDRDKAFN